MPSEEAAAGWQLAVGEDSARETADSDDDGELVVPLEVAAQREEVLLAEIRKRDEQVYEYQRKLRKWQQIFASAANVIPTLKEDTENLLFQAEMHRMLTDDTIELDGDYTDTNIFARSVIGSVGPGTGIVSPTGGTPSSPGPAPTEAGVTAVDAKVHVLQHAAGTDVYKGGGQLDVCAEETPTRAHETTGTLWSTHEREATGAFGSAEGVGAGLIALPLAGAVSAEVASSNIARLADRAYLSVTEVIGVVSGSLGQHVADRLEDLAHVDEVESARVGMSTNSPLAGSVGDDDNSARNYLSPQSTVAAALDVFEGGGPLVCAEETPTRARETTGTFWSTHEREATGAFGSAEGVGAGLIALPLAGAVSAEVASSNIARLADRAYLSVTEVTGVVSDSLGQHVADRLEDLAHVDEVESARVGMSTDSPLAGSVGDDDNSARNYLSPQSTGAAALDGQMQAFDIAGGMRMAATGPLRTVDLKERPRDYQSGEYGLRVNAMELRADGDSKPVARRVRSICQPAAVPWSIEADCGFDVDIEGILAPLGHSFSSLSTGEASGAAGVRDTESASILETMCGMLRELSSGDVEDEEDSEALEKKLKTIVKTLEPMITQVLQKQADLGTREVTRDEVKEAVLSVVRMTAAKGNEGLEPKAFASQVHAIVEESIQQGVHVSRSTDVRWCSRSAKSDFAKMHAVAVNEAGGSYQRSDSRSTFAEHSDCTHPVFEGPRDGARPAAEGKSDEVRFAVQLGDKRDDDSLCDAEEGERNGDAAVGSYPDNPAGPDAQCSRSFAVPRAPRVARLDTSELDVVSNVIRSGTFGFDDVAAEVWDRGPDDFDKISAAGVSDHHHQRWGFDADEFIEKRDGVDVAGVSHHHHQHGGFNADDFIEKQDGIDAAGVSDHHHHHRDFDADDFVETRVERNEACHARVYTDTIGGSADESSSFAVGPAMPFAAVSVPALESDDEVAGSVGRIQSKERSTTAATLCGSVSAATKLQAGRLDDLDRLRKHSSSQPCGEPGTDGVRSSRVASVYEQNTSVTTTLQWLDALHISAGNAPMYFTALSPPGFEEMVAATGGVMHAHAYKQEPLLEQDANRREKDTWERLINSEARSQAFGRDLPCSSEAAAAARTELECRWIEMSLRDTDERLRALTVSTDFVTERAFIRR